MGVLESSIKGKYYKINYFNRLNRKILNGEIREAYKILKKALLTRDTNDHDNDYRICLILLEKYLNIAKSEIDRESILEFTEEDCSFEAGYGHFIKFREYVLSSDWEKALESITKFSQYEKDIDGYFGYLSQVYYRLVYEIVFKENTKLDSDIINKLINAKEYKKLFNILNDFGIENLNGNYLMLFYCLKYLINLSESKLVSTNRIVGNKNLRSAKKRFFEMMKCGRYKEALAALEKVNRDKILFYDVYKILIEEILKLQEVNFNQTEIMEIIEQIFKGEPYDKDRFVMLLDEKIRINKNLVNNGGLGVDIIYDELAKALMEVFELALRNKIDLSYFQEFVYVDGKVAYYESESKNNLIYLDGMSYDKDDIISKFLLALRIGDYLMAFQCVFNSDFNKAANEHPKKKYLFLYREILFKIKKCCDKNKKIYEKTIGKGYFRSLVPIENWSEIDSVLASNEKVDYVNAFNIYNDGLENTMFQGSPRTKKLFEKLLGDLS